MSGKSLRGPAPSLADACQPAPETAWVYLLRCPDGSLYGGWTNDLARRLKAHRTGKGGAKYTKSHGGPGRAPLPMPSCCADKSAALKREAAIKKLPKAEKEALAAKWAADNCITIRMATPADGAAVAELYNWYVLHGTQTFQYRLSTAEEYARPTLRVCWKSTVSGGHHPGRPLAGVCLRPPLAQPRGLCLECGGYHLLRAGLRRPGVGQAPVHRPAGAAADAGLL